MSEFNWKERSLEELIQTLVQEGMGSHPDLLDEIHARGEEAGPALVEVLAKHAHEDSATGAAAYLAAGLLGDLRYSPAIPALAGVMLRKEDTELVEQAATALAKIGPETVETTLGILRNDSLPWFLRSMASNAALDASAEDSELHGRVTAELRQMLVDFVGRWESLNGDEDDLLGFLALDLAKEADAEARPHIDELARQKRVSSLFCENDVEQLYAAGRKPEPHLRLGSWLESHRHWYERQEEKKRKAAEPRPVVSRPHVPPRAVPSRQAPAPPPPRIKAPTPAAQADRPGRNEPCWCGSGKKYKSCHLSSDLG